MRDQGVLSTRPSRGSVTRATPSAARTTKPAGIRPYGGEEAVVGERLLSVAKDVLDEALREVGLLGPVHDRDRIGRDDVHLVGDRDERDLVRDVGDVGDVADPGVRLARHDLRDHGLHVLLVRNDVRERRRGDPRVLEDLSRA